MHDALQGGVVPRQHYQGHLLPDGHLLTVLLTACMHVLSGILSLRAVVDELPPSCLGLHGRVVQGSSASASCCHAVGMV